MASLVPVGSVLSRVYYTVPHFHGFGPQFDTHEQATVAARRRKDDAWSSGHDTALVWIDERWVMTHPEGGSTDLLHERTEYAPTETREQWATRNPSPTTS